MHAQLMPVCGNLFHHAVEMSLKSGLTKKRKLSELKDMLHNLKVIWRAFKEEFPDATLKKHNQTISLCVPKTLNPTIVVMKSAQDGA